MKIIITLIFISMNLLGAGILFFLLYLPYTVLINYDTQTRTWHKIFAVIFDRLNPPSFDFSLVSLIYRCIRTWL